MSVLGVGAAAMGEIMGSPANRLDIRADDLSESASSRWFGPIASRRHLFSQFRSLSPPSFLGGS